MPRLIIRLAAAALFAGIALSGVPAGAEDTVEVPAADTIEVVLDASGSMKAKMDDGNSRFDAARLAVLIMLEKLPQTSSVALRVYGHQSTPDQKNCDDTELVADFGSGEEHLGGIRRKVADLQSLGYTPISVSLQKAAADLAGQGEGQKTVILVSDGKETCKSDPCAIAKALAKADANLVVHTIGFGVNQAARQQLQCVAKNARGEYFDANSAGDLTERLNAAARSRIKKVEVVPQEEPKAATGFIKVVGIEEIGRGVVNSETAEVAALVGGDRNPVEVPAGLYTINFANGDWPGVEVVAGKTTEVMPAYAEFKTSISTVLFLWDLETGDNIFNLYPGTEQLTALVPGRYRITTKELVDLPEIEFKAGETVVLNPPVLKITGGDASTQYWAKVAGSDGYGSGPHYVGDDFLLPQGRYLIGNTLDENAKLVEVEVKNGGSYEIQLGN